MLLKRPASRLGGSAEQFTIVKENQLNLALNVHKSGAEP